MYSNSTTISNSKKDTTATRNTNSNKLTELTIDEDVISGDGSTTPQASPNVGARFFGACAECGHRIANLSDACYAMGYLYHNSCFVCGFCQRSLCGKTFYKDQDRIYCEEDYFYCGFQQTSDNCSACGHLISDKILQALGQSFHPGCFICRICSRSLDGVPFATDSNKLIYCLEDYYLVHAPLCGACGMVIKPEKGSEDIIRVAALDKEFHIDCYKCCDCGKILGDDIENRCYPMTETDTSENKIYRLLCLKCHLSRIGAVPATTLSSKPVTTVTTSTRPSGYNQQLRFYPVSKFQSGGAKTFG